MSLRSLRHLPALATVMLVALLASATSCGLFVSFGSYDTSLLHAVGGTARGLDGATVTILLNGTQPLATRDGPFVFPEGLAGGASYVVTVRDTPPGRTCLVDADRGRVTATDVTDVIVECTPSKNADLMELSLSAGPLAPPFRAENETYGVMTSALFSPTATVTARPADPGATVIVDGIVATSDTVTVPISPNATSIAVVVTAADGTTTRNYSIVIGARPSDYLKASNPKASVRFGDSIALSGDTLAVGAPGESSGAERSGAVYIFTRTITDKGTKWSQQALLKASNFHLNAAFGTSVALAGGTLAVGAPKESSSATGVNGNQTNLATPSSGAVYLFTRSGAGAEAVWSQQSYVKASNNREQAQFGWSVALSEDLLVVGAQGEASRSKGVNGDQADLFAAFTGAAYVFAVTPTGVVQEAYLKASNSRAHSFFGRSVAVSGQTVAVGSPSEMSGAAGVNGNETDTSAPRSGAVYVFTRANAAWSQQAYVKASNPQLFASFGWSVALSGDTLVAGAKGESGSGSGVNPDPQVRDCSGTPCHNVSGAAYVFVRAGTGWSQQAYLKASNTRVEGGFGMSVAVAGDTLAVGGIGENGSSKGVNGTQLEGLDTLAGAAYLFRRSAATWSQAAYVKASNTRANAEFGMSLALSRDTLAVAAPGESNETPGVNGGQTGIAAPEAGATYVFQ